MTDQSPPPSGHNNPPAYNLEKHAELAATIAKFMDVSTRVRNEGPVETDEKAQLLADHIAGLRGLKKQAEETKKAEKAPHDEAGKAVVAAYDPLIERLDRAAKAMLALSQDYLDRKRVIAEAEKRRKEAEAEAKRKEAEAAAAAAAASGSIDAEIEAERLAKEATKAEKSAAKNVKVNIGSSTGAGRTVSQRTYREAEIQNINALFLRYRTHPKMIDLLQSLANADVRAKELHEANAATFGISIVERKAVA